MKGTKSPSSRLLPSGALRVGVLLAMVRHHWFIRVRWIIAAATALLLLVEVTQTSGPKRPIELLFCIATLAVMNTVWTFIGSALHGDIAGAGTVPPAAVRRVTLFANAQMTVDLLLLTVILRYSGGIENPMSVFYIFHVMISVLLLTPLNALLQGCWALLLYTGLGVGECTGLVQPHFPFLPSTAGSELYKDWAFVSCGIGVLAAGIVGTLYFTYQISRRLDDQEAELQEANADLMRSQVAIQDLQDRRSRFMLTAAHQLKGPLAGIETLAGLIRDDVVAGEDINGVVARIIARCRQAIAQVTELLTLARVLEVRPSSHRKARTDVAEVTSKVVDQFLDQARAKNINLQSETCCPRPVFAAVESRDLEDCVANLLDNAVKYTPEGGSVWVRVSTNPQSVVISVKDTGIGIAEDSPDDLFDPFRRGNSALAANIPGSGLGLAIVREVVEQAHGRINVQSVEGEGSEFTLSFPKRGTPVSAVRGTRTTTLSRPAPPEA
ncbi:MAG: HAMP domain-containing histidine kinase [Planctomycetes bacterium]|nr:HAMP domain-containing histidine kinase [Planctomycetota bacterium]